MNLIIHVMKTVQLGEDMSDKKRISEDIPLTKRKGEIVSLNPSKFISEIDRLFDDFKTTFQDIFSSKKRQTWPIKIPKMALPEVRAPFCDLASYTAYSYAIGLFIMLSVEITFWIFC